MNCTIFGATGFIGSHLTESLRKRGHQCLAVARQNLKTLLGRDPLGHVFYCIGLTADFRQHPFETVDAHVSLLSEVLQTANFDSFLYLSSTRVYSSLDAAQETARLLVSPLIADDLYNISKLMGEALCLAVPKQEVRVARLSNVIGDDFGSDNFLNAVLRDAVVQDKVILETSPDSEKDFVSIEDVLCILPQIAFAGKSRLYNVARGENIRLGELLALIEARTGCAVQWKMGGRVTRFPSISVERIRDEFGFEPEGLATSLDRVIQKISK